MSEVSGIIRNSIERGWSIAEVRASLLNAGYEPQDIESELRMFSGSQAVQQPAMTANSQQILIQPQNISQQPAQEKYNPQSLSNYQMPEVAAPKASNALVIVIIVLLVLCIAAGVGLFLFG